MNALIRWDSTQDEQGYQCGEARLEGYFGIESDTVSLFARSYGNRIELWYEYMCDEDGGLVSYGDILETFNSLSYFATWLTLPISYGTVRKFLQSIGEL